MLNFFTTKPEFPIPSSRELWCLPLGGVGEIGQNLMIYGHAGQYLMVDCGMGFLSLPNEITQTQRVVPDISPLLSQKNRLQGIVITHGHEDHLGALVHVWPQLQVPIYASAFSAALIERKFAQAELDISRFLYTIATLNPVTVGFFEVQWLPVTHSIVQSHSLQISTALGTVLHTADWKMDANPLLEAPFSFKPFGHIKNLVALIGDSTNALKPGKTPSESACFADLLETVQQQPYRVVVSCFSSNLARLITLARVAKASGRYFAVMGRAMEQMLSLAKAHGYWPADLQALSPYELGYLPRHEVMLITTGSQGEPNSGLWRLARNNSRFMGLEAEDCIIFSANKIPDNLVRIQNLIQAFKLQGITVIHAEEYKDKHLHVSGHPSQQDIVELYQHLKPPLVIPVHGEAIHLQAHAQLIKEHQLAQTVLLGENGDLFQIIPSGKVIKNRVEVGLISI
ncbi:ribonuclease J [Thiosulfativibrio zosterae]|nr:ribonuclease J [Thiosulfativibrio zosterae]